MSGGKPKALLKMVPIHLKIKKGKGKNTPSEFTHEKY